MEKLLAMLKKLGAKDDEIAAAREEIETETAAATEKLRLKNEELIKEKRKLSGAGNEEVSRLQDEVETLKGQLTETTKVKTKLEKDLVTIKTDLESKLSAEQGAITRMVIDNGLTEGLVKLKIKPEHLPYVKAGLASKISLESEGDVRKAVVSTKDKDGKDIKVALSDFLEKHWATGEGKAFIPADQNVGGGGREPGKQSGGGKSMTRGDFETLDPASKAAFMKEGGSLIE